MACPLPRCPALELLRRGETTPAGHGGQAASGAVQGPAYPQRSAPPHARPAAHIRPGQQSRPPAWPGGWGLRYSRRVAAWRVAVLLVAMVGRVQAAPTRTAVFLSAGATAAVDESAVLDAVAIYTRDLAVMVRVRPGPPAALTPTALGGAVATAQADGADVVFWCAVTADGVTLYAVSLAGGAPQLHEAPVPAATSADGPRAIALKLRAIITGAATLDPTVRRPPIPIPREPPAASRPAAERSIRTEPVGASRPAPGPARFRLGSGYWLTTPLTSADLLRQGLAVEGAVRAGATIELTGALEVMTRPSVTNVAGVTTVTDLPLRIGARWMIRRGRTAVGLGPIVSLHFLFASAVDAEGRIGEATDVAAGLGGGAVARLRLTEQVSVEVRALVERLLPRTRFLIGGTPALDDGGTLLGLGLGVSYPGR